MSFCIDGRQYRSYSGTKKLDVFTESVNRCSEKSFLKILPSEDADQTQIHKMDSKNTISREIPSRENVYRATSQTENDNESTKYPPFTPLKMLGRGTYGTVYKSYDEHNQVVALKIIQFSVENDGIPSTVLREISLLKEFQHENIIQLLGIRPSLHSLVLVFEMAACDLRYYQTLTMKPLSARRVKSFMYQLLNAINYVHKFKILHRDLKPQNLLLLEDGTLKVADFGLARAFSVPVRKFAHEVVTLWYRPPDVLLGNQNYTTGVDMWSVGCIFAEMLEFDPLFVGKNVEDHIAKIFEILGTPSLEEFTNHEKFVHAALIQNAPRLPRKDLATLIPHADADAIDLIKQLLVYDGEKRLCAEAALQHPYFTRSKFEKKIPLNLQALKQRQKLQVQKSRNQVVENVVINHEKREN